MSTRGIFARHRRIFALTGISAALVFVQTERTAYASTLDDADEAITAMELPRARTLLGSITGASAAKPEVGFQWGRLALYEGDCDAAVKAFAPPAVVALPEAGVLAVVAKGCARAMAGTVTVEDKVRGVVVRFQDDADRDLLALIAETIDKQRTVLAKDLGVIMPRPTHVDVVRDQFSLAAMTGLPHKAAQTTGTVAIAKFGRVITLSPRAMRHGYAYRDTIAHEFTHLALSRGTLDRAPLWLQEGVAKREETRWRPSTPFDDAIPSDVVAAVGLSKGLGRPLDAIGPSIALLPTAREAMVVYAEVTSFVRFVAGDRAGAPGAPNDPAALSKLVAAYAKGLDTDASLREATGKDLAGWNVVWRPWVETKRGKLPASVGLTEDPKAVSTAQQARGRTLRIGELLLGRGFVKQAREVLDPLAAKSPEDPVVLARAARARLLLGDLEGATSLVGGLGLLVGDFSGFSAVRAEVLRAAGEHEASMRAYAMAVAEDPFSTEVSCGWATEATERPEFGLDTSNLAKALCEAARAAHTPALGRD